MKKVIFQYIVNKLSKKPQRQKMDIKIWGVRHKGPATWTKKTRATRHLCGYLVKEATMSKSLEQLRLNVEAFVQSETTLAQLFFLSYNHLFLLLHANNCQISSQAGLKAFAGHMFDMSDVDPFSTPLSPLSKNFLNLLYHANRWSVLAVEERYGWKLTLLRKLSF